ncbi:MAG: hypothetical protein EAZ24_07440 [Burkholderiales bacterium]|nr:MAG: hypothetical protein EAZ24_07440 [Burkholderiales bacterium]
MDVKVIAALIGVVAGGAGYWVTTFWMKPIVNYIELRSKVAADLIYYAQVVSAEGLKQRMQELYEERVLANRRHSADLAACTLELPFWYRWYLRSRGCSPNEAVRNLIGLSNATDYDDAEKRIGKIKVALGLKNFENV